MSFRRISFFFVLAVVSVNMAFGQVGATGSILGTITEHPGPEVLNAYDAKYADVLKNLR